MKCPKCQERYEKTKYITTVKCESSVGAYERHGVITVWLGESYIGKKYRVVIEETRDERTK